MLLELKVQNLAIIEAVTIKFGPGLNVLTGETGAGKSILLAALNLVLGERSDRDLIRTGKQEAWAEALFEADDKIAALLKEIDVDFDPQEPLALRRVIQSNGRSRAYVNCVTVPANFLKQLAPFLVDFGRQHEQSILLNPEKHLELLDRYGRLEKQRQSVEAAYRRVKSLQQEHSKLQGQLADREERSEFLLFQRRAIATVDPQPGEEQELTAELKKLSNFEKCRQLAARGANELDAENGHSVQEVLSAAIVTVRNLVENDDSLDHVLQDLQAALIAIEEAARSLRSYRQNLHLDSERLEEVQQRLDEVIKLQERYGGSYENVMQRRQEIESELAELAQQEKRYHELRQLIDKAKAELYSRALPLSTRRRQIAEGLAKKVVQELADLAMPQARFVVDFKAVEAEEGSIHCIAPQNGQQQQAVAGYGLEGANFLLSANTGEDLRPLENVASGGELSRILLALKHVLAQVSTVQTFVFDEIDAGVSGTAAALVAQKLRHIAGGKNGCQVICITHTPQIAGEADHHFCVGKETSAGRTKTVVQAMQYQERVEELARMLGGEHVKERATELARELLRSLDSGA